MKMLSKSDSCGFGVIVSDEIEGAMSVETAKKIIGDALDGVREILPNYGYTLEEIRGATKLETKINNPELIGDLYDNFGDRMKLGPWNEAEIIGNTFDNADLLKAGA